MEQTHFYLCKRKNTQVKKLSMVPHKRTQINENSHTWIYEQKMLIDSSTFFTDPDLGLPIGPCVLRLDNGHRLDHDCRKDRIPGLSSFLLSL